MHDAYFNLRFLSKSLYFPFCVLLSCYLLGSSFKFRVFQRVIPTMFDIQIQA